MFYLCLVFFFIFLFFFIFFLFFCKQKTAYWMRISDWISDVCSSDLDLLQVQAFDQQLGQFAFGVGLRGHRASVRLDRAQAGIPAAPGLQRSSIAPRRATGSRVQPLSCPVTPPDSAPYSG